MAAEFVYSLVTCTLNRDVHIHLLCEEHSSNDSFSVWHHIQLIKKRNRICTTAEPVGRVNNE
ncbi:hypothetical protein OUZ56_008238 [Daphnia magna]|uniref:Uncharacterized protein n=1 Tax=Daphnia magna TaxID=35525 RepID=A0ABR0ACE3_9CRUS|nr:hypothetical protein OUZ56_008238 [Daphnia magna]